MTAIVARSILTMAVHLLRPGRPDWAAAMQVEYDEAADNGTALPFAIGCLSAAWRDLPFHGEGRFRLSAYVLALGLIVPLAVSNIGCALPGFQFMVAGHDRYYLMLAAGGLQDRLLADSYKAAVPLITAGMVSLGSLHFLIAWAVFRRRFARLAYLWPLSGLVAVLLLALALQLFPSVATVVPTVFSALLVELIGVPILIRWRRRLQRDVRRL